MKKLFSLFYVMFLIVGISGVGHASLVIEEVYYDAPGIDTSQVFTEIYGTPGMSLNYYSLVGINGTDGNVYRVVDLSGAVLPSNGLLVIAEPGFTAFDNFFAADVDWQNGPGDTVQLVDRYGAPDESIVDALAYGYDTGLLLFGEGDPAPDVAPGYSLSRYWGVDTDDNLSDFYVTSPTPGAHVPIPGAVWLLGSGLIGLIGLRRRLRI